AQLNHQIKQFEFVTDVMPQIVWATNADGYHDFYNQRWYEFTGLTFEDTKDTGWSLLLHPDDLNRTVKAWTYSLHTGEPYDIEYRMRRADGEYRWLLARALPLFDDNGEVVKWFGTCTDIHEQKLLERQKDDFLGIASHELKTPVTSIKAYAQVLESMLAKKGDTKEAGMVSKMNGQINRLTNLIGDLLDVTKINSGRLQFNQSVFSFNEMVRETVEELQRTTSNHQIVCETESDAKVLGDRERIGQVLTNMITNAIKYSPNADKIIVRTSISEAEVTVCVEDFGVGIREDNQEKVFEQFYRVSGDMQHTFPGLGLGLYISSEIVKREGGRIWVNSVEGRGSTFCFTIPLKAS
ncbi:MAG: PAS domain-containing sensor histidine kinase, partial [Mucilaginibacter polytrichastri]|nr:PAS domain-containing sensor histidine kinase [Mucilaginibacter polytrichastri]